MVYQVSGEIFKIADAISGVIIAADSQQKENFQKNLQNLSSCHNFDKFSSKNACHVQLRKLQYNAWKTAAIQNPVKLGHNKMKAVHKKFETTEAINDFFLPNVSARTDVGNSKIHIQNVKIFDINTISKVDNHVYL